MCSQAIGHEAHSTCHGLGIKARTQVNDINSENR